MPTRWPGAPPQTACGELSVVTARGQRLRLGQGWAGAPEGAARAGRGRNCPAAHGLPGPAPPHLGVRAGRAAAREGRRRRPLLLRLRGHPRHPHRGRGPPGRGAPRACPGRAGVRRRERRRRSRRRTAAAGAAHRGGHGSRPGAGRVRGCPRAAPGCSWRPAGRRRRGPARGRRRWCAPPTSWTRWSSPTRRPSGPCGASARTRPARPPGCRTARRPGPAGRTARCRPPGSAPICATSAPLLADHGLRGTPYGHFGDGCIHVRIDFDLLTGPGVARFRRFSEELADLVVAHGGSPVRRARRRPGPRGTAAADVRRGDGTALRAGQGGLGPRRPAPTPGCWSAPAPLRRGSPLLRPAEPPGRRHLRRYPADGGDFAAAVRRCVGVAKCRTATAAGPAVMCPPYRATGEQALHARPGPAAARDARGRSDHRRVAVHGGPGRLDLCLSCKGCRSDCPVGVDMATYKAEFLHHHYAGRRRPAAHHTMGRLPEWLHWTARLRLAPLLNVLAGIGPLAPCRQAAGRSGTGTGDPTAGAPDVHRVVARAWGRRGCRVRRRCAGCRARRGCAGCWKCRACRGCAGCRACWGCAGVPGRPGRPGVPGPPEGRRPRARAAGRRRAPERLPGGGTGGGRGRPDGRGAPEGCRPEAEAEAAGRAGAPSAPETWWFSGRTPSPSTCCRPSAGRPSACWRRPGSGWRCRPPCCPGRGAIADGRTGAATALLTARRARVCCGLTYLSTGQLDRARTVLRRTLDLMEPVLRARVPVVVLEPSCAAALRTDLPELLPDDPRAARLSAAVLTFAETLERHAPHWAPPAVRPPDRRPDPLPPARGARRHPDRRLRAAAGLTGELSGGCCGLGRQLRLREGPLRGLPGLRGGTAPCPRSGKRPRAR